MNNTNFVVSLACEKPNLMLHVVPIPDDVIFPVDLIDHEESFLGKDAVGLGIRLLLDILCIGFVSVRRPERSVVPGGSWSSPAPVLSHLLPRRLELLLLHTYQTINTL